METKTNPASFAGNNNEVTPGSPKANHVWQWGVRWPTAEGAVDEWYGPESAARLIADVSRGECTLIRRILIQGPAEVVA